MEPLDDKELNGLLREWKAPDAPPSLQRRVLPRPRSRWRWFLTGSIRIPAPVGIAAIVILALWMAFGRPAPAPVVQAPRGASTLADFQPVEQLQPKVIERTDENGQPYYK